MNQYYKIKNIPGLNGLHVRGQLHKASDIANRVIDVVEVFDFINANIQLGDRELKYPVPEHTVYINTFYLKETPDFFLKEFSTENPFGKLAYEGHWSKGTIHVDYAVYENGMSVNVKDTSVKPIKTVFTQNFFNEDAVAAENCIQQTLRDEADIDDLVFSLHEISDSQ